MSSAVPTGYSMAAVEVSQDLLTVKPFKLGGSEAYPQTLEQLRVHGYRIVEWGGRYVRCIRVIPLLTEKIGHPWRSLTQKEWSTFTLPAGRCRSRTPR